MSRELTYIIAIICGTIVLVQVIRAVEANTICKTIDSGIERIMEGVESCVGE